MSMWSSFRRPLTLVANDRRVRVEGAQPAEGHAVAARPRRSRSACPNDGRSPDRSSVGGRSASISSSALLRRAASDCDGAARSDRPGHSPLRRRSGHAICALCADQPRARRNRRHGPASGKPLNDQHSTVARRPRILGGRPSGAPQRGLQVWQPQPPASASVDKPPIAATSSSLFDRVIHALGRFRFGRITL